MNTFLRKIINLKDVVIFYYTSFFYTISLCLRHILLNTYYCNKKHLHIYPQLQGVQQQLQQQQQVLQVFRFTQSRTRRVRVVSVVVRALNFISVRIHNPLPSAPSLFHGLLYHYGVKRCRYYSTGLGSSDRPLRLKARNDVENQLLQSRTSLALLSIITSHRAAHERQIKLEEYLHIAMYKGL